MCYGYVFAVVTLHILLSMACSSPCYRLCCTLCYLVRMLPTVLDWCFPVLLDMLSLCYWTCCYCVTGHVIHYVTGHVVHCVTGHVVHCATGHVVHCVTGHVVHCVGHVP